MDPPVNEQPSEHEYPINRANARELALKSWEARRSKKAAALSQLQAEQSESLKAEQSYEQRQLVRVREQIDWINGLLMDAKDASSIDRLTAAISRLHTRECHLAGRHVPGPSKAPTKSFKSPPPTIRPTDE